MRTVFKWGYEAGLIDRPIRFGPHFKKPSRKVIRKARYEQTPKMFSAEEIRSLIDKAGPPMKAMILLGINARSATMTLVRCP